LWGGIVAKAVPISEGQSHFIKGCPSKDLRISIVVPPTDAGSNDHIIRKCIDLIIMGMSLLLTHKSHFYYRCVPTFGFGRLATMGWLEVAQLFAHPSD
jgi:hypothetical protein